jgi:hypothetical protein
MSYDKSRFITAPWKGWDNSAPAMILPHSSFKQITGWLINKGRVQSFPSFSTFPNPPDGLVPQGGGSFYDAAAAQHTAIITKHHVYFITNSGIYTLLGSTQSDSFTPFSTAVFLNKLFMANGQTGNLTYVDGTAAGVLTAGDVFGTCFFLGKVASSLVMLNLHESGQDFPLSVRWCAINNPLEWDATVNVTAGSALIPEVEDAITGFANQKGMGVIYRNQGITIMSPTGNLLPRFSFNSFESGPTGVGVNYPYTLGNFGDESCFAAVDDIYHFSLSEPTPIGGAAKKSIMADLDSASDTPHGVFLGALGQGVDYKAYWLSIPQSSNSITSTWIYHFDDQTWINEQFPYGKLYWMDRVAIG